LARKNTLQEQIASAQSLATNFISAPTIVSYMDNCSYQINVTTSDSTGTFSVQTSNDYQPATPDIAGVAGNWADLSLGGGSPAAAAANDTIIINLNQLPFKATRITYTAGTAGTGHCDIFLFNKQIGG
jgi:hypothetical protein